MVKRDTAVVTGEKDGPQNHDDSPQMQASAGPTATPERHTRRIL